MDKEIKQIMKRLGEAINEAMQESHEIQRLLQDVDEKGYSLTLSLAVIVGVNNLNRSRSEVKKEGAAEGPEQPRPPRVSSFDRKFLKALRIKVSEDNHS